MKQLSRSIGRSLRQLRSRQAAVRARDLERAEPLIRAALDRKPEFPEAQVVLSNLHESRGDLAAALSTLESALKQRPDWAEVLFNYSGVLWKLRRLSEAETALRARSRSIRLVPRTDYWGMSSDVRPASRSPGSLARRESSTRQARYRIQ